MSDSSARETANDSKGNRSSMEMEHVFLLQKSENQNFFCGRDLKNRAKGMWFASEWAGASGPIRNIHNRRNRMKRKAILLGVLTLFVAGSASAKIMNTFTRIQLQFTNLARAQASDTGIGVTTLNASGVGAHLNTIALGNGNLPGLSLNTVLPVTDPIVSGGGIVSVRLTGVRGGN